MTTAAPTVLGNATAAQMRRAIDLLDLRVTATLNETGERVTVIAALSDGTFEVRGMETEREYYTDATGLYDVEVEA